MNRLVFGWRLVVVGLVAGWVAVGSVMPEAAGATKKKEENGGKASAGAPATGDGAAPVRTSTNPLQGKKFENWMIECETDVDNKSEKCFATQTLLSKENNGRLLKFSVGRLGSKGEWVAVAILPLGLSIPAGVAFKVDENEQVSMPLQQCLAVGCVANAPLDDKMLTALEKGKILNVGLMPYGSMKTLVIPASLKGFKAARADLPK